MTRARAVVVWCAADLLIAVSTANPAYRTLALLAALNVVVACRVRESSLRPLLIGLVWAILFAVAVNLLLAHSGEHILWSLSFPGPITLESLLYGIDVGLGVAACALAIAPLFYLMEPSDLADCLPAKLHRTGIAISGTMLLIPGLARSAQSIREAHDARGLHKHGNLTSIYQLAVPVCLTALEESIQRAETMESRGFGSARHTDFVVADHRHLRTSGIVAITALAAMVLVAIELARQAMTSWYPFPAAQLPSFDLLAVLPTMLLLSPVMVWKQSSN